MQPATFEQLPILRAATKTKRFEMRRNRRLGSLALIFISAWLWPGAAAQEPEDRKAEKLKPTGVATGAPHAPVKDAMSRPITAGAFVGASPDAILRIPNNHRRAHFTHLYGRAAVGTLLE